MMEQPLVSVIIPAYNILKLLKPCLESVLRQDITDMEIIVVDDGSADGTWKWLQAYAAAHPQVKPIHLDNAGVAAARNTALEAATGRFIRFIDGDDLLPDRSMRLLLEPMLSGDCDFAVGAYYRRTFDRDALRNLGGTARICTMDEYMDLFSRRSTSYYVGAVWNKLFRRDLIMEHGLRFQGGLRYGEDFLFTTEYMALVSRVAIVSDPVYVYYFNPKGMSVRQAASVFKHPIQNIQNKACLYHGYKRLFVKRGLYEKYRMRIKMYPAIVNIYD